MSTPGQPAPQSATAPPDGGSPLSSPAASAETAWASRAATILRAFLNPRTVLIVGDAPSELLTALHEKGMQVHSLPLPWNEDQPVTSNTAPPPTVELDDTLQSSTYDLVIVAGDFQTLPAQLARELLQHLCKRTDEVIFCPTGFQDDRYQLFTIIPQEYWALLFNQLGLSRCVDFDASFLTTTAMRFQRSAAPIESRIVSYERQLWHITRENDRLRSQIDDLRRELKETRKALKQAAAERKKAQAELAVITSSPEWKVAHRVQLLRRRLAPPGTRRARALRLLRNHLPDASSSRHGNAAAAEGVTDRAGET